MLVSSRRWHCKQYMPRAANGLPVICFCPAPYQDNPASAIANGTLDDDGYLLYLKIRFKVCVARGWRMELLAIPRRYVKANEIPNENWDWDGTQTTDQIDQKEA